MLVRWSQDVMASIFFLIKVYFLDYLVNHFFLFIVGFTWIIYFHKYIYIERNSLSVDENICSPMGVELSGEGIAGRR